MVAVPKFTKWIAERQRQRVFSLEQARSLHEVRQSEEKQRAGGGENEFQDGGTDEVASGGKGAGN